jgi:hypothetical protein
LKNKVFRIKENNIGQRLQNIENEQQRSLIDQQRIYTLEYLVKKFNLNFFFQEEKILF